MEQQLARIQMALPRPSRFVTSHPVLLQGPATVMLRITDNAGLHAQNTFQLLLTTFCTFLGKLSRGALCACTFGHLAFTCLLMCCTMFSHMPVQLLNKPYPFKQWPLMRQQPDNTPACTMAGYWQDVSRKSLGHAEKEITATPSSPLQAGEHGCLQQAVSLCHASSVLTFQMQEIFASAILHCKQTSPLIPYQAVQVVPSEPHGCSRVSAVAHLCIFVF